MKAVDAENSKNLINDYRRCVWFVPISPDMVRRERIRSPPTHQTRLPVLCVHTHIHTALPRRLLQITKAVAEPSHPWGKYSTGNLKTLRDDLPPGFSTRAALLAFHREHYHAGNMALALVGPAPLDALEALVREKFGPIVAKEAEGRGPAAPPPAFGVEEEAVRAAAAAAASARTDGGVVFRNPFPPRSMAPSSSSSAAASHSSPLLLPKPGLLRQGSGAAGGTGGTPGGGSSSNSSSIAAALHAGGPMPAVPIVRVVPLQEKRELRLLWGLPPARPFYRAPPTR
jgi:hypothetical protein